MASMRKKISTRHIDPTTGKRVPAGTPGAEKFREESTKYYAFDVPGASRPIPLARTKKVSETMFARLIVEGESALAGMQTGERKTVDQWIAEYDALLLGRGRDPRNLRALINILRRFAAFASWTVPARLTADSVSAWLANVTQTEGRSAETHNQHLKMIRSFARWLALRPRRLLPGDLLDEIPGLDPAADPRHLRRCLTVEEIGRLLVVTLASPIRVKALDGPARHAVYSLACATGFRCQEIGTLTPGHFLLDASPPIVRIAVRRAKNRRTVRQPLPLDVAALVRTYCEGRPVDGRLFPSAWWKRAASMLRVDLQACGIPYTVDSPDGPLHADFHALRHTYISLLEQAGVSLRDAMQLARHTDPKLTLARYARSQEDALGRAVASLPVLPVEDAPLDPFWKLFAWLLACTGIEPSSLAGCLRGCLEKPPSGETRGDKGQQPRREP